MPASAKQLIQGMYDSFARGDVPAVLGAYDDQMKWEAAESSPYADRSPYVGPEEILNGVFVRILVLFAISWPIDRRTVAIRHVWTPAAARRALYVV